MTSTFANNSASFANTAAATTARIEQKEIEKSQATKESELSTQAVKTEKTGSTCCGFCDSKAS